jgi:glycine/D-amino acid oxidase-like deaminating enzyme
MSSFAIDPPSADDDDVRAFSPPSGAAENLTCQLLIAGGGLSGLGAAEAAVRQGLDVIVIEKGEFGKEAASGLNAGQFLTGWVKPVDIMLAELARQERERGLRGEQAQLQAQRRVRSFLRRTVEGCQRLVALNHDYNLRASVLHGAAIAAMNDADLAGLKANYDFMEKSNFSAMMSPAQRRRRPFYQFLSARQFEKRHGTAEGFYAGGVVDYFGGSFRPRKLLHALARALQKRGVRFFQNTEAQALDFSDDHMTVFCGNSAAIRANTLFMANAYARHINGDVRERTIFTYDYVVQVELPQGANVLTSEKVLSDTRHGATRISGGGDARHSSCACLKAFPKVCACAPACAIRKRRSRVLQRSRQTSRRQIRLGEGKSAPKITRRDAKMSCMCSRQRLFGASPNFARACGRVSVGGHPDKRPDSRLRKRSLP